MLGYMEQTVADCVVKALTATGTFKPKYPFLTPTRSALLYVAFHLKGEFTNLGPSLQQVPTEKKVHKVTPTWHIKGPDKRMPYCWNALFKEFKNKDIQYKIARGCFMFSLFAGALLRGSSVLVSKTN